MKKYILFLVAISVQYNVYSQGCSDPGLCTVGILASDNTKDSVSSIDYENADLENLLKAKFLEDKFKADLTFALGFEERNEANFQTILSVSTRVKNKQLLTLRVPYTRISGEVGNIHGMGDVTLSYQNLFKTGKNQSHSFIFGAVLPTNNANKMLNGKALPMAYQTSLGVTNILAGFSSSFKMLTLSVGYQQPLGVNGNTFHTDKLNIDPRDTSSFSNFDVLLNKYGSSNSLKRSGDIVVRAEGHFKVKNFAFYVSALPIFRIGESQIKDIQGNTVSITGTNGLTFNYNLALKYSINNNWVIRANYGQPLVQRSTVVDGLVRSSVSTISVIYKRP